ncbi:MAG: hypothetical protein OET90_09655 [Desulfuromonadales bacterium]|nr:hypothetical protein [Desulfuromonadales bacterium]
MQHRFIMTAFGKDRPGIVADVTRLLYQNGCNLEDTSMAMLSDEFTLNLLFSSIDPKVEQALNDACKSLENECGISAFVRPLQKRHESAPQKKLRQCTLHIEGLDQAGIVYKISQFLADNAINIVDLKSNARTSPESGASFYLMDILIQLCDSMSAQQLEQALVPVVEELNVDISIS